MSAWKPIQKVLAGLAAGVILPGVFAILDQGADIVHLSGGAWTALLISTFVPLLTAYLVPSKPSEAAATLAAAKK